MSRFLDQLNLRKLFRMRTHFDPARRPSDTYMNLPVPDGWAEVGLGRADKGDHYLDYETGEVKCSPITWSYNPVRVVVREPCTEVERLREVERAARVYLREFDHLIGSLEEHDYPERRRLRDALASVQQGQTGGGNA